LVERSFTQERLTHITDGERIFKHIEEILSWIVYASKALKEIVFGNALVAEMEKPRNHF
jgi:hypothetical protein